MLKLSDHLYIPPMGRVLAETAEKPHGKRAYAAARLNRRNKDWTTDTNSANRIAYRDLKILRARARQMCRDSGYFRKYLQMCKNGIIGPKGLQLQSRVRFANGKLNLRVNKAIEDAFWRWSFRETCTLSGKMDWVAAQRLCVDQLVRDGECLVRHIKADNAFGYAIKLINVDWLDERFCQNLSNGNRIIMSVEVDVNDKSVAYWLTPPVSETMFLPKRMQKRERVPAEDISHIFLITDDESQTRGVTWFHAALLHAKVEHEYTGGVVHSARVASHTLGFLEQDPATEEGFTGYEDDDGRSVPVEIDVEALSFNELPPGVTLKQFDPKQPTQNHTAFKKAMLADEAAALNVPYFSLAGDMTAVNYSSARTGQADERDMWRALQDFVATTFCREVYHRWLRAALLAGEIELSPRDYQDAHNPIWRARGWKYLEPEKEIKASSLAISNKLQTWTDALAEQGIDLEDHLETLKQEQELAARKGVELVIAVSAGSNKSSPEEEKPDEETGNADDDEK